MRAKTCIDGSNPSASANFTTVHYEMQAVHGQAILVRDLQPLDALALSVGARLRDAVSAVQLARRVTDR